MKGANSMRFMIISNATADSEAGECPDGAALHKPIFASLPVAKAHHLRTP